MEKVSEPNWDGCLWPTGEDAICGEPVDPSDGFLWCSRHASEAGNDVRSQSMVESQWGRNG